MRPNAGDADRQINRLAAMARFDTLTPEALLEYRRVVLEHAASVSHAERTMTAWIDGHRWLPSCAELIEQFSLTPERQSAPMKRGDWCPTCRNEGFAAIWVLVTYILHPNGEKKSCDQQEISAEVAADMRGRVDGRKQLVASAVKACECPTGQWMKAGRIQYETEESAKARAKKS